MEPCGAVLKCVLARTIQLSVILGVTATLFACATGPDRITTENVDLRPYYFDTKLWRRKYPGNVYAIKVTASDKKSDAPLAKLAFLAAAQTARELDCDRFSVLPPGEHILTDDHALEARKKLLSGGYNQFTAQPKIQIKQYGACNQAGDRLSQCRDGVRFADFYVVFLNSQEGSGVKSVPAAPIEKSVMADLSIKG